MPHPSNARSNFQTGALRRGVTALVVAATAAILAIGSAAAQRGPFSPGPSPFGSSPPAGARAGEFDYYTMALSWSPTFCAGPRKSGSGPDLQCDPKGGRPFAFVLHGLWPQYDRGGSPDSCPTRGRIPQPTIDRMLDIMPAPGLVVHQYRKHGSCSGLDPDAYFALSRKLFEKVKIPPRFQEMAKADFISVTDVIREFRAVNPEMTAGTIAVTCGSPGDRLREVRVCFGRDGSFRTCGANEVQGRLCRAQRLYVPPMRGGAPAAGPRAVSPGGPGVPLPLPR